MARIQVVNLSDVDEKTRVTFFRLVVAAVALVTTLFTSLAHTATLFLLFRAVVGLDDFGCVLIIVEESVEFHRHHLLQDFVLFHQIELAIHIVEEWSDFFLIHFHLLNVVEQLHELLFANFRSGRHDACHELLANLLFNRTYFRLFLHMDDAKACSCLSCASCSSTSVRIAFYVVGQTVVNNVGEVGNIESTSSYVGSHKQLDVVLTKFRHGEVALCLTQFPMQTVRIVAVLNQLVGYLLCFESSAAEDDGVNLWIVVSQSLQRIVFVLCLHQVINVVHVFSTFVTASHHNLLGIVQIVLADTFDFLTHRG